MSRIVSGHLHIASEPVDLAAVVAAAVDTVRPAADSKGVSLLVGNAPAGKTVVNGDAGRLRQIVWNLLSNAVKFTPAGGRIEIETRPVGAEVEIVVRDNGEGIDAAFLPFVFDRFRQADGRATRRHGGLGLGLAIVKHLTEAHGGTATAHSDGPGKGAQFSVRLPALAPASRRRPRPASGRARAGRSLRGTRILAVDDEADARELLRTVLEMEGATVSTAESAGEALHLLQENGFHVLLADIGMPDQDGLWLIEAIRNADNANLRIPAIAVTAYASLAERDRALEAGYDWHLPKPVDPEQLVAAVAQAASSRTKRTARRPRKEARRRR
jgi:CheY-like chemotaxis protein